MRFKAEVSGLLRFVPKALVASVARRELGDALARVKERLEADG